ncbi:unnamed protein product [Urochloa humidicola]
MLTSSAKSVASPDVSGLDYDDTALTLSGSSNHAMAATDCPNYICSSACWNMMACRARAVGWPPVRASFRHNTARDNEAKLIKVVVDGTLYLRKVDLVAQDGYAGLLRAIFASCLRGSAGTGRLIDAATGAKYVPTYEDMTGCSSETSPSSNKPSSSC